MYASLADALNFGLEQASKIDVDGLPKFEKHIVFVPLDEGVDSDRDLGGSLFEPDLVLMFLTTACTFRKITYSESQGPSQFITKLKKNPGKGRSNPTATTSKILGNYPSKKGSANTLSEGDPPVTSSTHRVGWKDLLSAVEVKRGSRASWPVLGNATEKIRLPDNQGTDGDLLAMKPQDVRPQMDSGTSRSETRKNFAPFR